MATAVIVLDLVSKWWTLTHLRPADVPRGGLQFAVVTNRGAAWGLGSSSPFWVLSAELVGTLVVGWWLSTRTTAPERVSVAVVLGGAVANLVDRLGHGAVTDWIRVGPYPAYFNVADVAVRGGLIAAAALALGWQRFRVQLKVSAPTLPAADRSGK